jgi:hypothetical protein
MGKKIKLSSKKKKKTPYYRESLAGTTRGCAYMDGEIYCACKYLPYLLQKRWCPPGTPSLASDARK